MNNLKELIEQRIDGLKIMAAHEKKFIMGIIKAEDGSLEHYVNYMSCLSRINELQDLLLAAYQGELDKQQFNY